MSFTFFTLGGRQFWEDMFICKKWRIQRNLFTKNYRLLDNWDIRRATGTFDECLQCFEKAIKIFQLSSPKNKAMVFIHGLCGNKNQFNKITGIYESLGYEIVAVNYPSTRKKCDNLMMQFDFLLNSLEGITEISFITLGSGGLLLRKLLTSTARWRKKLKINKIIMINPPNRGCRLWEKLANYKCCRFVFGPILGDFESHTIAAWPQIPESIDFGIINASNKIINLIKKLLPQRWAVYFPQIGDSFLPGNRDMCFIKTWHFNPLYEKSVIQKCKNFFVKDKF